ncbi:MAG TPA: cation transporter, partial [Actinotalea caeni]|nr:cation transporter [Actinotalea caeni]
IEDSLRTWGWVRDARARVRDQGHVFHVEAFVVPVVGHAATLDELRELRERLVELDWKIDDVVVAPVEEIPPQLEPGEQAQAQEQTDA